MRDEGDTAPEAVECVICGDSARGGLAVSDSKPFECPDCGVYRVSHTALHVLANKPISSGVRMRLKALIEKRRQEVDDDPLITSYDL
jgi:hypothetical protein